MRKMTKKMEKKNTEKRNIFLEDMGNNSMKDTSSALVLPMADALALVNINLIAHEYVKISIDIDTHNLPDYGVVGMKLECDSTILIPRRMKYRLYDTFEKGTFSSNLKIDRRMNVRKVKESRFLDQEDTTYITVFFKYGEFFEEQLGVILANAEIRTRSTEVYCRNIAETCTHTSAEFIVGDAGDFTDVMTLRNLGTPIEDADLSLLLDIKRAYKDFWRDYQEYQNICNAGSGNNTKAIMELDHSEDDDNDVIMTTEDPVPVAEDEAIEPDEELVIDTNTYEDADDTNCLTKVSDEPSTQLTSTNAIFLGRPIEDAKELVEKYLKVGGDILRDINVRITSHLMDPVRKYSYDVNMKSYFNAEFPIFPIAVKQMGEYIGKYTTFPEKISDKWCMVYNMERNKKLLKDRHNLPWKTEVPPSKVKEGYAMRAKNRLETMTVDIYTISYHVYELVWYAMREQVQASLSKDYKASADKAFDTIYNVLKRFEENLEQKTGDNPNIESIMYLLFTLILDVRYHSINVEDGVVLDVVKLEDQMNYIANYISVFMMQEIVKLYTIGAMSEEYRTKQWKPAEYETSDDLTNIITLALRKNNMSGNVFNFFTKDMVFDCTDKNNARYAHSKHSNFGYCTWCIMSKYNPLYLEHIPQDQEMDMPVDLVISDIYEDYNSHFTHVLDTEEGELQYLDAASDYYANLKRRIIYDIMRLAK